MTNVATLARRLMGRGYEQLSSHERIVIDGILSRLHLSRNVNREFEKQLTLGQRLADRVAAFGGSWPFIGMFAGLMVAWVLLNTLILRRGAFDPYPYILLNLFLSMLAAVQAPIIMMSQNRQAAKDRLDASLDYEVNLKAELEVLELHRKIDELRDQRLVELTDLVRRQGDLIARMQECLDQRGT